jgi:GH24 family phage-related lysozyme (muramidase)
MRASVRTAFKDFSAKFEGVVHWMYLDVKGLVTTGIGNLIDPVEQALVVPWQKEDGSAASEDEIRAEWQAVKDNAELATAGFRAAEKVTSLRITDDAVEELVLKRLEANVASLKRDLPGFSDWPADAQLGILSMAWAMGAGFHHAWPKFSAAIHSADWAAAAENCLISTEGNAGVHPRNEANVKLFGNADAVAKTSADPDTLYHPGSPPAA